MSDSLKNIGGPMPAVGTQLCSGWKEKPLHMPGAFRVGTVIAAVVGDGDEADWVAVLRLCRPHQYRSNFQLLTNVEMHVGNWRTMDRADETSAEGDAAQKRQVAAWEKAS